MEMLKSYVAKYPFGFIFLSFHIFRFLLIPFFGLMPQDAYYYFYGQNLALSYFDHPGMLAYILRLFTTVFGHSPFIIKLADFSVSSLTMYTFYVLAGCFLSGRRKQYALVLFGTSLLVSIVSTISTPDVPLLLFWTLALISIYKAIFEHKNMHWAFAGLFMGLAFNSKYPAVFLPFGLLIFLCLSSRYRSVLISKWLWLSLLISVLTSFPVLFWNYQHQYVSFLFQAGNRSESISRFNFNPEAFFGTVGHQAVILLPVLFFSVVAITYHYAKKTLIRWEFPDGKSLFLLSFFVPVFIGFFTVSLFYWVKINWMMPAYISGIILVAHFISKKWVRINVILSVAVHLFIALEIVFYFIPVKSDDTWFGWEQLARETTRRQKQYPGAFIFSDDNYKTTSELAFFTKQKIYAQNIIGKKALQYDFIGDNILLLKGRDALFIDSDPEFKDRSKKNNIPQNLTKYFAQVHELEPIIIKKDDRAVRKFWIYFCDGYKPL